MHFEILLSKHAFFIFIFYLLIDYRYFKLLNVSSIYSNGTFVMFYGKLYSIAHTVNWVNRLTAELQPRSLHPNFLQFFLSYNCSYVHILVQIFMDIFV